MDRDEAARLYKKAADLGDARAAGAVETGSIRLSLTASQRIDISVKLEREFEGGLRVAFAAHSFPLL